MVRRVAVAGLAAVLLVGCGTDPGRTKPTTAASTGQRAGSRAQAEMFARQLLGRFAVPQGTRLVRLSPVPPALRDPWTGQAGSSAPGSVDLGRLYTVALTLPAAKTFMLVHEPGGTDLTGTGQENSPGGPRELYLHFGSGSLPQGIDDAEAVVLMAPRSASTAVVSIYVHVLWFPSRTAAEHLDAADFGSVTVSAVLYGSKLRRITQKISTRAGIAALAERLNHLPAAPDATQSCPGSNTIHVTFNPRTSGQAEMTATTYGCYGLTITTAGVPQPALLDAGNTVAASIARMLGVSAK